MNHDWLVSVTAAAVTIATATFGWLKRRDVIRFKSIEDSVAVTKSELIEARKTIADLRSQIIEQDRVYTERLRGMERDRDTLLKELNLLRAAVAQMEIGRTAAILVADEHGRIVDCNPMTFQISGWTKEDLIGQNIKKLIPFRLRKEHDRGFREVVAGRPIRTTAIESFMMTSLGEEVAVKIYISSWEEDGKIRYGAEIRRRAT